MKKLKLSIKYCLVFGLVAIIFLGVFNFSIFNKRSTLTASVEAGDVVDGAGKELVSGKVYSMSNSMTFSAPSTYSNTAEDGVLVQATVKPDTLTNKNVDWSISWVDSESSFAKGKNVSDFVSVEEVDSNIAQIKCLEPFGERINLIATSELDTSKSAICVLDYAYRVSDVKFTTKDGEYSFVGSTSLSQNVVSWDKDLFSAEKFFYGFDVVHSDIGTVMPASSSLTVSFNFPSSMRDVIDDYFETLTQLNGQEVKSYSLDIYSADLNFLTNEAFLTLGPRDVSVPFNDGNLLDNLYIVAKTTDNQYVYEPLTNHVSLVNNLLIYLKQFSGLSFLICRVNYNDEFSHVSYSFEVKLKDAALNLKDVEVSLDNSGIVL